MSLAAVPCQSIPSRVHAAFAWYRAVRPGRGGSIAKKLHLVVWRVIARATAARYLPAGCGVSWTGAVASRPPNGLSRAAGAGSLRLTLLVGNRCVSSSQVGSRPCCQARRGVAHASKIGIRAAQESPATDRRGSDRPSSCPQPVRIAGACLPPRCGCAAGPSCRHCRLGFLDGESR